MFLNARQMDDTLSLTVGDGSESVVGCQIIRCGTRLNYGLTQEEMVKNKNTWEAKGVACEHISLNDASGLGNALPQASVLIGRNMIEKMGNVSISKKMKKMV